MQLKPISRLPVRLADNPGRPRNRVLIGLGILLVLGLGVFGIAGFGGKPPSGDEIEWDSQVPTEQKLKWVETRLARGEDVDLVPNNRNPRWFRLLAFDAPPLRFARRQTRGPFRNGHGACHAGTLPRSPDGQLPT